MKISAMYTTPVIAVALSLSLCFGTHAQAINHQNTLAENFAECRDSQGIAVEYLHASQRHSMNEDEKISTSGLGIANARYLDRTTLKRPAIFYSDEFLEFSPILRDFALAHECYHLSSGDAITAYMMVFKKSKKVMSFLPNDIHIKIELAADCAAAKNIRSLGYSTREIDAVTKNLPKIRGVEQEERTQNILNCYLN